MNLRLLKAFVTLAEKGNYAETALALAVSQPALTKQINLLESTLGVALFSRGRHGTTLTAAGKRLLPEAEKVIKQATVFLQHAAQVAKGGEGLMAVGFGLSSFYFAPRCIAQFRSRYPGVDVSLEDLPSEQQCGMLQSADLQVGFVRVPAKAPLEYHRLFEDRLVLVTPDNSPRDVQQWLKALPLLRLYHERGRGLNVQTDQFLQQNTLAISTTQQVEDIQTIVALVLAGIGVALLPQSVAHIAPPGLHVIALAGEAVQWQVGIAWDPRVNDAVRDNFIAMVKRG
ncbi:LysR family transcriptional regulator [Rouxiella sp. S1S-2]|uniref:LysR family transcriptional regulator n=1 Tax=Rouxiella sp. S1S-2 TaxID=2653856 RepID=UPI0012641F4A|nr:LysR family transcriptional regulator [Rouxiella sp. S1S-2]KAB7896333.1 LysR family transcriptional regulator [Rouxiella sp. S1S-2]